MENDNEFSLEHLPSMRLKWTYVLGIQDINAAKITAFGVIIM